MLVGRAAGEDMLSTAQEELARAELTRREMVPFLSYPEFAEEFAAEIKTLDKVIAGLRQKLPPSLLPPSQPTPPLPSPQQLVPVAAAALLQQQQQHLLPPQGATAASEALATAGGQQQQQQPTVGWPRQPPACELSLPPPTSAQELGQPEPLSFVAVTGISCSNLLGAVAAAAATAAQTPSGGGGGLADAAPALPDTYVVFRARGGGRAEEREACTSVSLQDANPRFPDRLHLEIWPGRCSLQCARSHQ
eukprot:COSAG01_NODE_8736_length_2677_cov_10.844065_1_plen_249_part_00